MFKQPAVKYLLSININTIILTLLFIKFDVTAFHSFVNVRYLISEMNNAPLWKQMNSTRTVLSFSLVYDFDCVVPNRHFLGIVGNGSLSEQVFHLSERFVLACHPVAM